MNCRWRMAALADRMRNWNIPVPRARTVAETYQGELLIMLPDTFGTTQFLQNAPDWVANWTGQRIDSKDPFLAGDEYIAWLRQRGRDPRTKRLIASDGLDVDSILALHAYFGGVHFERFRLQLIRTAWPTSSNAEKWTPGRRITFQLRLGYVCSPMTSATAIRPATSGFDPVSLVCKLSELTGGPRSSSPITTLRPWVRLPKSIAIVGSLALPGSATLR